MTPRELELGRMGRAELLAEIARLEYRLVRSRFALAHTRQLYALSLRNDLTTTTEAVRKLLKLLKREVRLACKEANAASLPLCVPAPEDAEDIRLGLEESLHDEGCVLTHEELYVLVETGEWPERLR